MGKIKNFKSLCVICLTNKGRIYKIIYNLIYKIKFINLFISLFYKLKNNTCGWKICPSTADFSIRGGGKRLVSRLPHTNTHIG